MKFNVYTFENVQAVSASRFATYCKPGLMEGPMSGPMKPLATYGSTREESVAGMKQKLQDLLDVCSTKFLGSEEVEITPTKSENPLVPCAAVVAAIARYNEQHPSSRVTVDELKWNNVQKCFFFERNGMLHGVELDGYIHT